MASPSVEKLPDDEAPAPTPSAIVEDPKTGIVYKLNRLNTLSTHGNIWRSWESWLSQILGWMLSGTWSILSGLYPAYFSPVYESYLRTMYVYLWVLPVQKLILWGLVWMLSAGEKERAWVRTGRGPDGRVAGVASLAERRGEEEKGEVNGLGMGW